MKRLVILSAIALAACGGEAKTDTTEMAAAAVSPDVTLALTVGAAIQAAPGAADSVLEDVTP